MATAKNSMLIKAPLVFAAALLVIALALFVPAGTLDYWQGWMYMATVFVPALIVIAYFMLSDPEFLERRFDYREKEEKQKKIINLSILPFIIGFLLPGLDHRFGWSNMPSGLSIAADVLVLLSYLLIFLVFKENRYAARTIRVEKGQEVITTGPYSIVRHPMYVGTLIMYLATPIALGSYWAFIPFAIMVPVIIYRIFNEEEVLLRELPGYTEYCKKARWRLIPHVW